MDGLLKQGGPPRTTAEPIAATAPGERIYAIGDVHGRFDLLSALMRKLEAHSRALPSSDSLHVILLGDLVDRGPDSAAVLDLAYRAQQRSDGLITLLGNHEEMMLKTIDGVPGSLPAWMRVGGDATLRSFGIAPPASDVDPRRVAELIRSKMPPKLLNWLRSLPLVARSGDYLFCHAGVRPGVPIKRQNRADLLWIRGEFLQDESDHGVTVVHGHSIANAVEVRANRIGIDTGAYSSGVLTGLYLERRAREIIDVTDLDIANP